MTTDLAPQRTFCLGTSEDGEQPIAVALSEDLFKTHFAILGGTGSGKSKLIELFCRQAITTGCGLCFLDPHSETADDILAHFAHVDNEGLISPEDIYYLNPSERPFSYDPFVYRPDADTDPANDLRYHSWLSAKVQDMVKIILRKQGEPEEDQEKMVRLGTWLRNGLYAVGVRHDLSGKHLPMTDIFAVINPLHDRHEEVYRKVCDYLPEDMRSDFEIIRGLKNPKRPDLLQHFIESTLNRLRSFMVPIVREIFSGKAPPIDFHEIVRKNGIILAALGKTEHFHEEWGQIIGGLILREISSAVRTIPAADHNQFYLIMDEAQNYLNDDIKGLPARGRSAGPGGQRSDRFLICLMPIRHTVRGRLEPRGPTPRRLAAAGRALQRERDRLPLFSEQIASEQESPEHRVERFDNELLRADQAHRDLAAKHWRWGRLQLAHVSAEVRSQITDAWNCSSIPPQAAYFADFVRRRLLKQGLPLTEDA